jgi:hypothetical protein
MAPEAPDNLVVLDISINQDDVFEFNVHRWDGANAKLYVLWNAVTCPDGYQNVGEGVICVAAPPEYLHRHYMALPRLRLDPTLLSWRDSTSGVLMLVAVFPVGYVYGGSPPDAPIPYEAKPLGERMAVYWNLSGEQGVETTWRIEPIKDRNLREYSATLNGLFESHPGRQQPPLDAQPPTEEELARRASVPPRTELAPPPWQTTQEAQRETVYLAITPP